MATTDYTSQITGAILAIFRSGPVPTEIASWNSTLNDGTTSVANMISALEFAPLGLITQQVIRLYQSAFNRAPDSAGLDYWVAQIAASGINTIAKAYLNAPEAINIYGQPTSNTPVFITSLYNNVLHRAPSDSEVAYYTTGPGSVWSPWTTLTHFSESPEAKSLDAGPIATFLGAAAAGAAVYSTATFAAPLFASRTAPTPTSVLTTGLDNLTGTPGNDLFYADNTGPVPTSSTTDRLNGNGGSDTLEILSSKATNALDALPAMTGIQTLWIVGAEYHGKIFDVTGIPGLTTLKIDAPTVSNGNGVNYVLSGQTFTLSNLAIGAMTERFVLNSANDASENIVLSNVTQTLGGATIDIAGPSVKFITITSNTSANQITIGDADSANIHGSAGQLDLIAIVANTSLFLNTSAFAQDVTGAELTLNALGAGGVITISGGQAVTIGQLNNVGTITDSGTGSLTMTALTSNNGITITASSTTSINTLYGTHGADRISTGTAADTVFSGGGADVITLLNPSSTVQVDVVVGGGSAVVTAADLAGPGYFGIAYNGGLPALPPAASTSTTMATLTGYVAGSTVLQFSAAGWATGLGSVDIGLVGSAGTRLGAVAGNPQAAVAGAPISGNFVLDVLAQYSDASALATALRGANNFTFSPLPAGNDAHILVAYVDLSNTVRVADVDLQYMGGVAATTVNNTNSAAAGFAIVASDMVKLAGINTLASLMAADIKYVL